MQIIYKKLYDEILKVKNSDNTHTFVFDFENESISNTFDRLSRYGNTESVNSIDSIGSAIELLDKKNQ